MADNKASAMPEGFRERLAWACDKRLEPDERARRCQAATSDDLLDGALMALAIHRRTKDLVATPENRLLDDEMKAKAQLTPRSAQRLTDAELALLSGTVEERMGSEIRDTLPGGKAMGEGRWIRILATGADVAGAYAARSGERFVATGERTSVTTGVAGGLYATPEKGAPTFLGNAGDGVAHPTWRNVNGRSQMTGDVSTGKMALLALSTSFGGGLHRSIHVSKDVALEGLGDIAASEDPKHAGRAKAAIHKMAVIEGSFSVAKRETLRVICDEFAAALAKERTREKVGRER